MKKILFYYCVAGFLWVGCAKNNETASQDTSSQSTSSAQQSQQGGGEVAHGAHGGTGEMEMQRMNTVMMRKLGPGDEGYDHRFIDMMIAHHQGAIMMARNAYSRSSKSEIKDFATNIIANQQSEVNQMEQWSQQWFGHASHEDPELTSMNQQMTTMLGGTDKEYEDRFIDMMIPHHEGAIMMAKDALSKSAKEEVKKLSQEILSTQQKEIDQMKQWRKQWYGQ